MYQSNQRTGPPVRPWFHGVPLVASLIGISIISTFAVQGSSGADTETARPGNRVEPTKIVKSEAEWRRVLTKQQYQVLRESATERPYANEYHDHKAKGDYACAGCAKRLFASSTKFDSGTGWPSFFRPIERGAVNERDDSTFFSKRTEVICSRCDGHLGHVFSDGPKPTGLRYCLNSAALKFIPEDSESTSEKP